MTAMEVQTFSSLLSVDEERGRISSDLDKDAGAGDDRANRTETRQRSHALLIPPEAHQHQYAEDISAC